MTQNSTKHTGTSVPSDHSNNNTGVPHYGNIGAEYDAVRTSAGICDQSHRGKLKMTGMDRQTFLHRVVTNNVQNLAVGEGVYACMLTPQGKIISDMAIYVREEDILIDVTRIHVNILKETLERYTVIDDVEINDITNDYGLIGVYGKDAIIKLKDAYGAIEGLSQYGNVEIKSGPSSLTLVHSYRTGEDDYEIYSPIEQIGDIWETLTNLQSPNPCTPVGMDAIEILRVEAGIPCSPAELNNLTIPNESVRERAISFSKGCYIGQEPVVMMEHRGQPNRLLSGFVIEGTSLPERNCTIKQDGKDIGWITTAVYGRGIDSIIALGFIRRQFKQIGKRVTVLVDEQSVEAEIVDLPFYISNR
tara:strand:+ start:38141 stop:39220 length:1080 start_codon:yes stop_codon:yes gene_type:complete